jgi:hypothetical protein
VPSSVSLQQLSNVRDKRIIGIRIRKKGANTKQHLAYGKSGTPLILENIETNTSIRVDVAVVDACGEVDLGGFEGVVGGEVKV